MSIDWAVLHEQLELYQIPIAPDADNLLAQLEPMTEGLAYLTLEIVGLEEYAQNYGSKAGIWLVLAVVRTVKEILETYTGPTRYGCVPPSQIAIVAPEEHQQEIGHRCLTAYQDIYHVLARTQRKPSSPIWHRRAITNSFPYLNLEVKPTGSEFDEDSI